MKEDEFYTETNFKQTELGDFSKYWEMVKIISIIGGYYENY